MKYTPEICEKAQRIIDKRRSDAEYSLQQRRSEILRTAPEIEEIERQVSSAAVRLSKLIITGRSDFDAEFERIKRNNLDAQEYITGILESKGFPADSLKVRYTCDKCSDTGFAPDGKRCECFYALASRLSVEELNRTANMPDCDFAHFSLEYYSRDLGTEGVIPYDKMSEVLHLCREYAESFSENSQSLIMIGKTGLGKTHLSLSIAKAAAAKGYTCVYGSLLNFLYKIENEHFGRDESGTDTMSTLTGCDLLVLDDLGAEPSGKFYEAALYNIINTRINLRKPVIISTNLDTAKLRKRYDERILSRIWGVYMTLPFYGTDIRQIKTLNSR